MDWWLILIIAFGTLLVAFCTGLPVAVSFLILDVIGLLWLFGTKGLFVLTNSIYDSVASITFTPIPLFILLGEILYQSKAVDVCFNAMDKWVGGIKARLHIVTLMFSILFGAISGVAVATVAILGSLVFPEMLRRGYDKKLSLGVCMAGSTLDPLIPPSVLAVVIASLSNVSTAKLLISGVVPGIMMAGVYMTYIVVRMWINPKLAPGYQSASTFKEKIDSLVHLLPFLMIIFLVLGLLLLGIATPTESAATGVLGAFFVSAIYGHLTFDIFRRSLLNTIKVTGMILIIFGGSKAYSQLLALSGAAQGMVNVVSTFHLSPMWILAVLQGIILLLGCFMDAFSIMMITIPLYLPILKVTNFDPLWFWCLYLVNVTVGGITPPFGSMLFVLKSVAKGTTLEEVYWAALPFCVMMIIGMLFMVFFPDIALWLPNYLFK